MVTEGLERFNKIVDICGLYVPEEGKKILQDPERMKNEAVCAYVNEEAFMNNAGYIISVIDECVYACLETVEDLQTRGGFTKEFCFNGCFPAWTYTDEMLIEHIGDLCVEYKKHASNKALKSLQEDFDD